MVTWPWTKNRNHSCKIWWPALLSGHNNARATEQHPRNVCYKKDYQMINHCRHYYCCTLDAPVGSGNWKWRYATGQKLPICMKQLCDTDNIRNHAWMRMEHDGPICCTPSTPYTAHRNRQSMSVVYCRRKIRIKSYCGRPPSLQRECEVITVARDSGRLLCFGRVIIPPYGMGDT